MVEITKLRANYKLSYDYIAKLNDFIKELPKDQYQVKMDAIQQPDGSIKECWYRLVSEGSIGKVIAFIKDNKIHFKFTNLTKEQVDVLKNQFIQRQKNVTEILKLKAENINVDDFDVSEFKIEPYKYQKQAVKFFDLCNGVALLGDSPGVGKTLSAIAYAIKHNLKTIIVCPASLKLNWRNEILNFTNEKPYVYKWKPTKKSGQINFSKEESLFHIINYEALETYAKFNVSHKCNRCQWTEINFKKRYSECPNCKAPKGYVKSKRKDMVFVEDKKGETFNVLEYGLITVDECHFLKNMSSDRTRTVKKLFKDTPRKLLLTGTAIKSRPYEFFSVLNFLDPLTWKNAHYFGIRYCAGEQNKFGWDYSGASNLEELYERIAPYFLRRLKKDVLKHLPPKTYTNIPIEMSYVEMKEYRKIETDTVNESSPTDTNITHLARIQYLKQYLSRLKVQKAIPFIQDIINGDEKIVVFSQYISVVEAIAEHFEEQAVVYNGKKNQNEKQEAVDKFMNDDNVKVFVGTIGAAGMGITLTSASILMFIDKSWTPGDQLQSEDRIHRATTTSDKVQIISLICQNTIDDDIEDLLNKKAQILSRVLDGAVFEKIEKESIFKELVHIILNKNVKK